MLRWTWLNYFKKHRRCLGHLGRKIQHVVSQEGFREALTVPVYLRPSERDDSHIGIKEITRWSLSGVQRVCERNIFSAVSVNNNHCENDLIPLSTNLSYPNCAALVLVNSPLIRYSLDPWKRRIYIFFLINFKATFDSTKKWSFLSAVMSEFSYRLRRWQNLMSRTNEN